MVIIHFIKKLNANGSKQSDFGEKNNAFSIELNLFGLNTKHL